MKALACLALLALSLGACTYHSETVVQKPAPTTAAVVVPDSPPPSTTVVVPAN
ncbi:MAG TPA: hypothetical protein VMI56_23015 [Reyranella sp.]|nr:hypothetical protein [Reyranella sp.]